MSYKLSHLKLLEAESMYVIREVAAQFENPVLLFSGGKDSIVVLHTAIKAFYPAKLPFPIMHVDTGHNFPETIEFRDRIVEKLGVKLIVAKVQDSIDKGRAIEETGLNASRNGIQAITLMDAIEEYKFDCALGGARRDEEKARAKERFFSHRDEFGQWDPKNQRPELWQLYNGKKNFGEHFRAFPISNWTELDVWQYLKEEKVDMPSIYFAHERPVIERNGVTLAVTDFLQLAENETPEVQKVRFRTIGDATCTGAWASEADTIDKIVDEISATRLTERASRADDKRSESAMEDRKKQGYF
ncbi:MAG: sulfate adenylyltransferase subunit CysD [Bacteroidia bacterium]